MSVKMPKHAKFITVVVVTFIYGRASSIEGAGGFPKIPIETI